MLCSPYPIDEKFKAFNFHVVKIDAHDFEQIRVHLKKARETKGNAYSNRYEECKR